MDVAVSVDRGALAGMNYDRCRGILYHGRAREAHAGLEPFGVIDVCLMRTLERIVDQPAALPSVLERGAGLRRRREAKLADLGRRDEVQAHNLDRRVEPISVFPLVDRVKSGDEVVDDLRLDRTVVQRHFDRMLLVLVAALHERRQLHAFDGDSFRRELVFRALRGLLDQSGQRRDDGRTLETGGLDEAGYEIIAT